MLCSTNVFTSLSVEMENLYCLLLLWLFFPLNTLPYSLPSQALLSHGSLEKPVQCYLSWLPQPALAQTLSLFQGLAHSKGNQGWDLIRRQARLHGSGPGPSQVIVLPKHLLSCLIPPGSFLVIFPYLFRPDPSLPVSLVISANIL